MLSVLDCSGYLRRRLDGEPSVPVLSLCNFAGEYLADMHTWGWLERPPASLSLIAGNDWINLPADFGRAIGKPRSAAGSTVAMDWATMDEIAAFRSAETASQLSLYGAIAWVTSQVDGTMRPRIELSVTPSASESNVLLLAYRARWAELVDEAARIPIPSWVEPLYLEILFAFAQAYDEHDLGTLTPRLAEIEASPVYATARMKDGGMQPSIGKMSGGAVQMLEMPHARSVGLAGRVADPS